MPRSQDGKTKLTATRIGVDATCWQNNRGYGRHVRALLGALARLDETSQYTFFLDSTENTEMLPADVEARYVRATSPTAIAAAADGHRSVLDLWRVSRAMSDSRFDLLLFPTIYSYAPVFSRAKKVVLIHDVIAETYPQLTLPRRTSRFFWELKTALGRWQADAIVTVSEYSRRGIAQRFKLAPERIFVVTEAADPVFRRLDDVQLTRNLSALGINTLDRYVVYVGGFGPHKNLESLVSAFARNAARPEFEDVRLVMVGEHEKEIFHSYFETIRRQLRELDILNRVFFTGFLPDEELVVLLNLATVLVLPSLIEGFGLPAVEAAACGCPVIATTESPLPELLGEGGIFINPLIPEELDFALKRILESSDLRERMRTNGLAAAGRLSWESAAQQMMKIIHQMLAS